MKLSRRIEIYDVAIPNKAHRCELVEEAKVLESDIRNLEEQNRRYREVLERINKICTVGSGSMDAVKEIAQQALEEE